MKKKSELPQMPDMAAREPAEGDLDFPQGPDRLCCPEEALSSDLPVEAGALAEKKKPLAQPR